MAPAKDTLDLQLGPIAGDEGATRIAERKAWRLASSGRFGELRPTERLKIAPARAYHGPGMGEQDAQYRPR
jgi:hypothetical protein